MYIESFRTQAGIASYKPCNRGNREAGSFETGFSLSRVVAFLRPEKPSRGSGLARSHPSTGRAIDEPDVRLRIPAPHVVGPLAPGVHLIVVGARGNAAHSSIKSRTHGAIPGCGRYQLPASTSGETAAARDIFPPSGLTSISPGSRASASGSSPARWLCPPPAWRRSSDISSVSARISCVVRGMSYWPRTWSSRYRLAPALARTCPTT